jgi:hypothetical protein
MAARTMIGIDSSGVGCIKIMKSSSDNPRTTPDSQRSKFLYNSKFDVQAQLADIATVNVPAAGSGFKYLPSGAGPSNYTRFYEAESTGDGGVPQYFRNSYFNNLQYNLPLFDVKMKEKSTGYFVQNRYQRQYSGKYYHNQGGYYISGNENEWGWYQNWYLGYSAGGTLSYGTRCTVTDRSPDDYNPFSSPVKKLVLWNLPGDQSAIADKPGSSVSGKKSILISSTDFKIAKPGYDVDTATGQKLAFDASNRPVKAIASGDIAISADGTTEFDTGFTLPSTVVADVHFYTGSTIYYPARPTDLDFGSRYYFSGSKIIFVNDGGAHRARFVIYVEDESVATSGGNKVLRQFASDGENVVQILRPGAAATPSWADIIIDSRWPAFQLLEEGSFTVSSGVQTETITFDASGFFPMVKYMTVHGAGSRASETWAKRIRLPFVKRLIIDPGTLAGRDAGDSSYCTLTSSQAVFYTFRGNVVDFWNENSFGDTSSEGDDNPITAIRYFIFGIPI